MSDNALTGDTKDEMIMIPDPTNNQPRSAGLVENITRWLSGQPFNNVMLFAIFAAGCYGVYWAGATAIPMHLKQIQSGYEQINQQNVKDLEQSRAVFERVSDRDYQVIQSLLKDRGIDLPNPSRQGQPTR